MHLASNNVSNVVNDKCQSNINNYHSYSMIVSTSNNET